MKKIKIFCMIFLISIVGFSQSNWNGEQLVIQNSNITRIVVLKDGVFTTQSYRLNDCPYNFVSITGKEPIPFNQNDESNRYNAQTWNGNDPEEFSFLLNDAESLSIESLNIPWGNTFNIVWQNYGRYKHIGPFLGNWDDPLVISHNPELKLGIAIGNEAPGILKRTSVCVDGRTIDAGLTHSNQDYAFRKWLNYETRTLA